MPAILITRPQPPASALAVELQREGYEGVIEPLLTIVPVAAPWPEAARIGAVMITSGNALHALAGRGREASDLFDLPCFCVGPRTAEKARAFGFRHAQSAASDGAELALLIGQTLRDKTAPVLHIAGQDTDSNAQDELRRIGYDVAAWPVYRAVPVTDMTPAIVQRFRERKLDAVTVFSPRTARLLVALMEKNALQACCQGVAAIGLSAAVTDVLRPLAWRQLASPPMPTEEGVITCLKKICPVRSTRAS